MVASAHRKRRGQRAMVRVPALHAMFFAEYRGPGAEE